MEKYYIFLIYANILKKKFSILTLIFSFITLLYCDGLIYNCTISKDASDGVNIVENCPLEEHIYCCGPKTRDYTETPPGGGIILIPVVLAIALVMWLIASIFSRINEGIERTKERQNKEDELYKLYHADYTKEGPIRNGVQLVKISNRRYGYVDIHGHPIIREIFHEAEEFTYPTAIVEINGRYALLNKSGVYVVSFGRYSWIYPIGNCLIFRNGDESYICNREGKKIYSRKIRNASLNECNNFILHLPIQNNIETELVIDETGNIITPIHNSGELPQRIFQNIALYHAGKYCGLIDVDSKRIILEAEENKIINIRFSPQDKQFIIDSIHYISSQNFHDIHYTIQEEIWQQIFDKDMNLLKTIKDVNRHKISEDYQKVEKISNTDNKKQRQSNRALEESINLQLNGGKFNDNLDLSEEVEYLNDDI